MKKKQKLENKIPVEKTPVEIFSDLIKKFEKGGVDISSRDFPANDASGEVKSMSFLDILQEMQKADSVSGRDFTESLSSIVKYIYNRKLKKL